MCSWQVNLIPLTCTIPERRRNEYLFSTNKLRQAHYSCV